MGAMERTLDAWIAEVRDELGIDLTVDVPELLDLARVVAHGVARPAAPLTTFLVGYAAGRQGGGAQAVTEAVRRTEALVGPAAPADGPATGSAAAGPGPGDSAVPGHP